MNGITLVIVAVAFLVVAVALWTGAFLLKMNKVCSFIFYGISGLTFATGVMILTLKDLLTKTSFEVILLIYLFLLTILISIFSFMTKN